MRTLYSRKLGLSIFGQKNGNYVCNLLKKGEETSKATPEEIAICEKVTGFAYDKLWNRDNALKFR